MNFKTMLLTTLILFSCSKKASTTYEIDSKLETVQQLGEEMAGIDEAGGFINGDVVSTKPAPYKNLAPEFRAEPETFQAILSKIVPPVFADACAGNDYGVCSVNQKIRSLVGCSTAHGASINGSVTLTYFGTAATTCTIPAVGDYVNRSPNVGINGVRGAVFGINSISGGQNLTRTGSTTFTYADSGTRRRFIGPEGDSLLDLTVTSSGTLTVTGSGRAGRTLTGGSLVVTNSLNSVSCEFVPAGITWAAGCNCPTAGSWAATCSDSSTLSMSFSSTCGEVVMNSNSASSTVFMDRCE
jgi:hypothetical protein